MRKKLSFVSQAVATAAFTASMLISALPVSASSTPYPALSGGDLIKLPDDGNAATTVDTAVYYYGDDGLRYVFPDSKTYFTWYSNFANIKVVTMTQLGTIGIGGNVTYRPGAKLIKITSDPKTYAVDRGGVRRWITNEAVAIALYGSDWNKKVDDVPDAFIRNYPSGGADINVATDFSVSSTMTANTTINIDKQLSEPVEISIMPNGTFSPADVSITVNHTVRWTNRTTADFRLKSNDLPGLDSAYLPAGLNYVYKFKQSGSFSYYSQGNPTVTGAVTVNP